MRLMEERRFTTPDGVELYYRYWPAGPKAVVLLHRGHEHSGRVAHIVEEIGLPEYSFFALDARGHGRSGTADARTTTMATFVQDLDDFIRHIRAEFAIAEGDIAVIGQSIGAVIAAAWVHDYAPAIRCLVLAAPAFEVKLYVPFARLGLALMHAVVGDFHVMSYISGSALTHDRERAASYATDPLIKRPISVRVLLSLYQMAARTVDDSATIRVPVQMLLSGRDWVVRRAPQLQFFERLGSAKKELHVLDGFFHDTLGEKDRQIAMAKARTFLTGQFSRAPARASLVDADQRGHTRQEYDGLRAPLAWWSPKRAVFGVQRLFLRTLGQMSEGIRIGVKTGFDSGASLDYVYRNRASGVTPLGRMIDWFYLNAVGWRGIRVRRKMIADLLGRAFQRLQARGGRIRVLDAAAGHGRYVLDGIAASGVAPDEILLRDLDAGNVAAGRALIAAAGLRARFEQGDAFDRRNLESLTPKATVGIVSGLYELFPENGPVRESLHGLAGAVEAGGYLVYTGQPWHPQLEMIARTLTSHLGGKPWVMRRRTQEELDELVREAGFRKVAQRIDPMGLFTVSLAERM